MWDELKSLLKHTSIYGAGSVLTKLVGFLLIPFYTHYLSPREYGTLELLDLSLSLVVLLVKVWVTIPLTRFYYDHDEQSERNKVVSTILFAMIAAAAVGSALGFVYAREVSWLILQSPAFGLYIQVISASFFLTCMNSVTWEYMYARQRSKFIVSLNSAVLALMVLLNVYFIAFAKLGVMGVLLSALIGHLVNASVLLPRTLAEVGARFDFAKLRKVALFGAPLLLTNLGAFTINFSDRFFLEHFSTMGVVGIYALGYKFGFMLSFLLIQPFYMIWSVRMYDIAKRKDAREIFSKFAGYFSLVLVTAALALSLIIKEVIQLVAAPSFHSAYRIVPVIALAYVFQGLTYYFQGGILIQKKSSYMAVMGLVAGAADLALNFLLIPRYQAMGAAWATAVSFAVMAWLAYVLAQRTYPIPYRITKLCAPIAAAALFYLASERVPISTPLLSAPVKLLFLPAFFAALYFLGFFDKTEIAKMKSILERLRMRRGQATEALRERPPAHDAGPFSR
jgi:O-antigen/teichoic acid export membrane protein